MGRGRGDQPRWHPSPKLGAAPRLLQRTFGTRSQRLALERARTCPPGGCLDWAGCRNILDFSYPVRWEWPELLARSGHPCLAFVVRLTTPARERAGMLSKPSRTRQRQASSSSVASPVATGKEQIESGRLCPCSATFRRRPPAHPRSVSAPASGDAAIGRLFKIRRACFT